jgi:pimeloyl-ACP methyl ester carboxylesterase
VRALQAPRIWGGMKQSAQMASSPGIGGAYYVAQQLAAFCRQHKDVELHAVGHSAGSIFHAWFIPCALALGAPEFRSLHLMAPAMRVDLFKEKLASLIGAPRGIRELTVYTMKENLEAKDTCAGIYRKSLLYLIFHALEPQRKTAILGLEESLRSDQDLSRMFGLDGEPGEASVVWSQTPTDQGRSASMATSHGGFDDDPATMGSIARRILRKGDVETVVGGRARGRTSHGPGDRARQRHPPARQAARPARAVRGHQRLRRPAADRVRGRRRRMEPQPERRRFHGHAPAQ